jgi:FkbH-like protein
MSVVQKMDVEIVNSDTSIRSQHPFDPSYLLRKHKRLTRALRKKAAGPKLKIAILGGSTTSEVANLLEFHLLCDGFQPELYQSAYNRYYEEAVFGSEGLDAFAPHYVYLHTTSANIVSFPGPFESEDEVQAQLEVFYGRLAQVWEKIREKWGATVIQNNFEPPFSRPLGQLDAIAVTGKTAFINRLNEKIAAHARMTPGFHVHDLAYLASWFGLERWYDRSLWYQSKYAMSYDAIPALTQGVASIIRADQGRSKKCLVLDLDNTLWGGVVGDDGVGGIRLGHGTPEGEAYLELQEYAHALQARGVILAACSKNDEENALLGLSHPGGQLRRSHFTSFKVNWMSKDANVVKIADEINIGLDSLVLLDDNPVERQFVAEQVPEVAVPDIGSDVTRYVALLDKAGYFETTALSKEDAERQRYYAGNITRASAQEKYETYHDFLMSLGMEVELGPYLPMYVPRITQLTNKTNQFNLTTRRFTESEMESFIRDHRYVTLYGRLTDRYGDNGLVTVLLGRVDGETLHVDLWLMSCRVMKRDLEWAMFQELRRAARDRGLRRIRGYYIPTAKNRTVAGHYAVLGFDLVEENAGGRTVWTYDLDDEQEERPIPMRIKRFSEATDLATEVSR